MHDLKLTVIVMWSSLLVYWLIHVDFLPKTEVVCSYKMLLDFHQITWYYMPEARALQTPITLHQYLLLSENNQIESDSTTERSAGKS
jgi:hypothetical protein